MKIKKILLTIFGAVLAVCVLLSSYGYSNVSKFTSAEVYSPKTIIIDAGHGGLTNTIKV